MPSDADSWDNALGAEVYAEAVARGAMYRGLSRRLIATLDPPQGGLVLDLACGTGIAAGPLYARLGKRGQVLGFDTSSAMLRVAERELPNAVASFVRADLTALPLPAACADGAICSAALWHLPALSRLLVEVARVLKRGSRFAFNVPATQLFDQSAGSPAPLLMALSREGERRFDTAPSPSGPTLACDMLCDAAAGAELILLHQAWAELPVPQRELIDLLSVPAIAARFYPDRDVDERDAWIAAAVKDIDPHETVNVRWWEAVFTRQ